MNLGKELIHALAIYQGWGNVFYRAVATMQRVNERMPDNTGAEKKAQFIEDCKIIGIYVLMPAGGMLLDALISLGLMYLKVSYPVASSIAEPLAQTIQDKVKDDITSVQFAEDEKYASK